METWSREAADELIGALARERQSLEALLFRLTSARHLVETGSPRFLGRAASDIDRAVERVREAESRRAAVAAAAAEVMGAGGRVTMRALLARAPEPYRSVLGDHRRAIGRLAAEVAAVAETANERARAERQRLETEMQAAPPDQADPTEAALQVELALSGYDSVLAATRPLTLPALSTFLG